ncbi:MAG TPA: VWA domain-containing protein [Vicinamibacterales bacterium]|nr:VWA domain-containing protein [Vicinamibacterales bacterium]
MGGFRASWFPRTAAAVAAAASLIVGASPPARAARQVPQFRGRIDLVNVGVTVTDRKNNLVAGLTADDFDILEEGKPQTVRFFAAGDADASERPPMHLGLLVDVSESMGDDLAFSKTAAVKFLNTLTDAVDITVVDFDTEIRTARYSQNEYARLIERIRQKKAGGDTALYDAIGTYLDGAAGEDGRKVMLLYTDGGDTRSSIGLTELMDLLKASDVTVYAIGELEHQSALVRNQQRMIIQQIAEVTGGRAFFPTAVKELDSVYEKVLAEIRAQYTLGYVSTNEKMDGKWRKVDVRMKRTDLRTRARRGYFALLRKQ